MKLVDIYKDRQPIISSLHFFMTLKLSEKRKKILLNLDPIKKLDIIDLPLKKPYNLYCILVLNLSNIKVYIRDTVFFPYYLNI